MSYFDFPDQTIPENKKNKDWHIQHIMGYVNHSSSTVFTQEKEEILELYYAANAMLSPRKRKIVNATITQCYGGKDTGVPYVVYPLIESQIEQVIGIYRERPLHRRAIVRDQEAVLKKFDEQLSYLTESIIRDVNKDMEKDLGFVPESPNEDLELPEDIEDWLESDFRTKSEETAEAIAHHILVVKKEKENLYNALYHYLVSGRAHMILDEKIGHPSLFVSHPLEVFSDYDPHSNVQSDLNYFVYDKYMSRNEIFNIYDLSPEDRKLVNDYPRKLSSDDSVRWLDTSEGHKRFRTVTMLWKSRRKVNFKVFNNEITGQEEYKIIPDDERLRSKDIENGKIVTQEIEDIRHITMIGPHIVLAWGRLDNEQQLKTLSDPKKRFIPAISLIDKNITGLGNTRSLAKKLMWLQDFASEILWELRLSLRHIDGNAIVYDLSNIPKQFLKDDSIDGALKKVQFYLKRDKMMLINSADKRSSSYASSVNVSQSKRINDIIHLLGVIEELASRITGVTDSLKGENKPYEKTGVAEMKLAQASTRIENYYGIFDSFADVAIERMCARAKSIYKKGQVFHYYAGDGLGKFFTIYPEFLLEDIGIYFDDNRREFRKKQMLDQIAGQAFSQTQYPEMMLAMFKIFNADTSNEAEKQLKKALKTLAEMQSENQQREQQIQEQQNQIMEQQGERERDLKREGYQKDVVVANIYANTDKEKEDSRIIAEKEKAAAQIEKDILLRQFDHDSQSQERMEDAALQQMQGEQEQGQSQQQIQE